MYITVTNGAKWCKMENNFRKAALRIELAGDIRRMEAVEPH